MLASLTLAATMTVAAEASGIAGPAVPLPKLDLPRPDLPKPPTVPGLPSPPSLPAPELPPAPAAPGLPQAALPPGPGAQHSPAAPGSRGAPPAVAESVARAWARNGSTGRSAQGPASRPSSGSGSRAGGERKGKRPSRASRERRLRRKVARLAGCLDAISGLERRVLVLRAGLGEGGPRSREATARQLGTSVRRVRVAERRGLRRLSQANRSSGCARNRGAGAPGRVTGRGIAGATRLPVITALLAGVAAPPDGSAPDRGSVGAETESSAPDLAGAPATPGTALAGDEASGFPLVLMLALLAMVLAAGMLRPGWRLAHEAAERRHERVLDQRQEELVSAARSILGEDERR